MPTRRKDERRACRISLLMSMYSPSRVLLNRLHRLDIPQPRVLEPFHLGLIPTPHFILLLLALNLLLRFKFEFPLSSSERPSL